MTDETRVRSRTAIHKPSIFRLFSLRVQRTCRLASEPKRYNIPSFSNRCWLQRASGKQPLQSLAQSWSTSATWWRCGPPDSYAPPNTESQCPRESWDAPPPASRSSFSYNRTKRRWWRRSVATRGTSPSTPATLSRNSSPRHTKKLYQMSGISNNVSWGCGITFGVIKMPTGRNAPSALIGACRTILRFVEKKNDLTKCRSILKIACMYILNSYNETKRTKIKWHSKRAVKKIPHSAGEKLSRPLSSREIFVRKFQKHLGPYFFYSGLLKYLIFPGLRAKREPSQWMR